MKRNMRWASLERALMENKVFISTPYGHAVLSWSSKKGGEFIITRHFPYRIYRFASLDDALDNLLENEE